MSIAHGGPLFQPEPEPELEPEPTSEEAAEAPVEARIVSTAEPATDPTVANAGLTEIDAGTDKAMTNGHVEESPTSNEVHIPNADVGDDAANAVAESMWDVGNVDGNGATNGMSMSQEWVEVPRDPVETEPSLETAPPAPVAHTASWADDQPDVQPDVPPPADPNDGFHQVQRHRGRGDRDGWRGRGGGYRGGRGFRGDGRGRGRGGGRGGAPFHGGPRRNEES